MGKRGPSKKPTEAKRKAGNPGQKKLPDLDNVVQLAPAQDRTPPRPLAPPGQKAWNEAWDSAGGWLAESDRPALAIYCEAVDEYAILRQQFLTETARHPDGTTAWRMRKQLHDLRAQVRVLGADLGLNPSARADLGVAEVRIAEAVHNILDRGNPATTAPTMTIDV